MIDCESNATENLFFPGPCPTNDILIEFKIQWKVATLLFITYLADHNEISHTSR